MNDRLASQRAVVAHTKARIEALLFVASRPVSIGVLARLVGDDKRAILEALQELQADYAERGVTLVEAGGGWQIRTKPEHSELVRGFLQSKPARLSGAALETLSIVAYKQPLTRAEVEDIRGVDCGAVLRGLLERRLLRILGKKEEPGRPLLYGTSPVFLEVFGLKNLRELPTLREFVELTEEHQRMVERQAPDPEEAKARELKDYLDEVGEQDLPEAELESFGDEREGDECFVEQTEMEEAGLPSDVEEIHPAEQAETPAEE